MQPEDGYGDFNPEAVVDLPSNLFMQDGKLVEQVKLGERLQMQDNQGNMHQGQVLEITAETVKMDFNHPLAGQVLNFSGEILDLREATEEELSHGHVHGPGGHEH